MPKSNHAALFGLTVAWYGFYSGLVVDQIQMTAKFNINVGGTSWSITLLIVVPITPWFHRYNVYNQDPATFRFPIATAALQLGAGLIYAVPLWILGIRKAPKITFDDFLLLAPIGRNLHHLDDINDMEHFQYNVLNYAILSLQQSWMREDMSAL
jgi:hypothetical protein